MRKTETVFIERLSNLYGSAEARQLARICLQNVLDCDFSYLLVHSPLTLTVEQQGRVDGLLKRLESGEPIQYIEGTALFSGLTFFVQPGVLIPRPETSELVDWVVGDWKDKGDCNLLDVGTGSGCIAVSLAHHLPDSSVSAVDVSEIALNVARKNAERNGVDVRLSLVDILTQMPEGTFDVVVSNPPYVCNSEKSAMHANVLDFEPGLALFVPDDDPLLFYRTIAQKAVDMLNSGGSLYFEINERFGTETVEMLQSLGYINVDLKKDFYGKDRMVKACRL